MWKKYNPNPKASRVGDCTVRALCKALGMHWEETYIDLALYGLQMNDMPSANQVWGKYLSDKGYVRHSLPTKCPECYSVKDFCREHPAGSYVLSLNGHVVAACDGDYFDTWDSGDEIVIYFWEKEK